MSRERPSTIVRGTGVLLVAVALAGGCGQGAAGRSPGSHPATAPPAAGAPAAGACTLSPTAGLARRTLEAPGPGGVTSRSYELHVPRGIDGGKPVPLLVSLHGLGANGTVQDAVTRWSAFDDKQAASGAPFVLALPDGIGTLWFWGSEDSYDVAFVFDVIAELGRSDCIDPSRIYVDGWSEGSYMAQRMACAAADPAVDRRGVALAAVHGYAGGDPAVVPQSCRPAAGGLRPASVLLSQGLDDRLIDPRRTGFPAFAAWGTRYGCHQPGASYAAAQQLAGCDAGAAVAWWPISGFGHLTWSCGATYWHDLGVWAFLTKRVAPTATTCA